MGTSEKINNVQASSRCEDYLPFYPKKKIKASATVHLETVNHASNYILKQWHEKTPPQFHRLEYPTWKEPAALVEPLWAILPEGEGLAYIVPSSWGRPTMVFPAQARPQRSDMAALCRGRQPPIQDNPLPSKTIPSVSSRNYKEPTQWTFSRSSFSRSSCRETSRIILQK